jgi:hypothetical protein
MCMDDQAIRQRLATNRDRDVRVRAFGFIQWARDAKGLCPALGDETWSAIDLLDKEEEVVARVFPKLANLLKIRNVRRHPAGHYGRWVKLNDNVEWSFDLASSRFDGELARECLSDQLLRARPRLGRQGDRDTVSPW